jgi:hypothetical protein
VTQAQALSGTGLRRGSGKPQRVGVACSGGLGNATGIATGILGGCLDRRRRQRLGCSGQQLAWIVWNRLVRIYDRLRLRSGRDHANSQSVVLPAVDPLVHLATTRLPDRALFSRAASITGGDTAASRKTYRDRRRKDTVPKGSVKFEDC